MIRMYIMLSRIWLIISFDSAPLRYALKSGKCNFEKQFHMAIFNNFVLLNKKILTYLISENKMKLCYSLLVIVDFVNCINSGSSFVSYRELISIFLSDRQHAKNVESIFLYISREKNITVS